LIANCQSPNDAEPNGHINLFGMRITRTTMAASVATLLEWCRAPRGEDCKFVVTPNTDHAVLYQQNANLRAAYAGASMVLADGAPLVAAANFFGKRLPERVAGSDLVPQLFESASEWQGANSADAIRNKVKVFLLGAAPGIAAEAGQRIEARWPGVDVVGVYSPPMGFDEDPAENAKIFAAMRSVQPDLVIVGLGAPRQELWVHQHQHELPARAAICAGATIDFLAGHKRRSPVWMRRLGLEWLHRLCSEPRRLATRYARDAWVFPQLLWGEWRRSGA
jgi:N-acetylglucosaminyldiphosphoundecaprenol N-acetyl-beta-D-mannosaminyltransferase